MFHTFVADPIAKNPSDPKQNGHSDTRKPSISRACEPCRRRKVKCGGDLPCDTCKWYRKPAQCYYNDGGSRSVPSKRPAEKATHNSLHQHRIIFQKLFPDLLPTQLVDLSREELIDVITRDSPRRFLQPTSPLTPSLDEVNHHIHPDANSLETFQPMPEDGSEASDHQPSRALQGAQDDVNMLSMSVKQTSSYLGISSVMAALRVIVWLDPEAQTLFRTTTEGGIIPSREITSPSTPVNAEDLDEPAENTSSAWDEIPHINSYFTFFHPMVPLLDEQSFRDTYITRKRTDPRWLLLLNVVLALGSAVHGTAGTMDHRIYYAKAQRHLTLETFGSAHLETVQALALLSGYYLHYLQLPNQCNSVMGMTIRLATALGLHRDYSEGISLTRKEKATYSTEVRRRIWWCIVCLDSWASCSLGRPSMGRINSAVTAKVPQQPIGNSIQILTLLQENINFAFISTKAEDALALSPIIDENERKALDAAYLEWFKSSSTFDTTPKPMHTLDTIGITVMKNIMRWRYLWNRIILHRPTLLWSAMRKVPFSQLSLERQTTIVLCRDLTFDLINDIASTWGGRSKCIMSAWHAAWLLYQATMVPLLSLFSDWTDIDVLEKSHLQIQMAQKVLLDQTEYTKTAKRSLEVVSLIYEAANRHQPQNMSMPTDTQSMIMQNLSSSQQPQSQHSQPYNINDLQHTTHLANLNLDTPHQELILDNMFDSLNWSMGWMDGSEYWVDFNNLSFFADQDNDNAGMGAHGDAQFLPFESAFDMETGISEDVGDMNLDHQ